MISIIIMITLVSSVVSDIFWLNEQAFIATMSTSTEMRLSDAC